MAKAAVAAQDDDVVHSGYLLYKVKGKLSSAYHQVICSLHRESLQGTKRLELKDIISGKVTVVPLRSLLEVREVVIKKERDSLHPFEVVCAKVKYLLAAENCEERDAWLGHINKVFSGEPEPGVTYEFRVSLQANESSKKHGLSGNYVLKVADCNIALYSATSLIPTQFTLRLTGIKRLQQCSLVDKHGIGEEILVIYTMPQSEVGEGTFVFKASNAGEISQVIDWRIKGVIRSNGSCENAGNADNSPPPPQVPDRRGRHNKQVESHIYHEEPRINLTERNGSVSSNRSIGSLKHQLSDVSISSGGSVHGNSHRRTLSSLKRGNSEDVPPTPPPRSSLNRPSVAESNSDADEAILVETYEIQAQIEALKKGGLLPQHSFSQMEERPSSPRRRPLRGTKSGGSPPFDLSSSHLSEARSGSHSPPFFTSSPSMARNHSSLSSNCSVHSDGSPVRKRFSKQSSSSSLAQSFTSDFPIDVIVRHDREMGHRQNSSESLPLSKWQSHKIKEARIPPELPERDRDENDGYYLRDIDINPGPVRLPRPNPIGHSGSETGSGSITNSSTDENGYLILTQDDKDAIACFKDAQMRELSTTAHLSEMNLHEQLYSEVDDFRGRPQRHSSAYSEDDYEPAPGVMGGAGLLYRRRQQTEREVEEVYDVDDEVLSSLSSSRRDDPSSPLSPYYNVRDVGDMKPAEHRGSSSEELDDASMWKDCYSSDAEDVEYYNTPFKVPQSTTHISGHWKPGEGQEKKALKVASSDDVHGHGIREMEYYNSAEQVVHRGRPQKKQSVQKSSSDSGTMGKTPAVSATQCNGVGSDTDEDEREDPRHVAELTRTWRSKQEHCASRSVDNLHNVKLSQNQVSVSNSTKTDQ